MDTTTSSRGSVQYLVETPVYEGPLDLLLQLIERAELDITKLSLALVTDQFLAHLSQFAESNAEEVSAFLVIASRLLQIKSQMLLPRQPPKEMEEEDPGDALAAQLIIYKRFKEIGSILGSREMAHLKTYLRLAPPPKVDAKIDLEWLTLDNLVAVAQEILALVDIKPSLDSVVSAPKVTIREKINLIAAFLKEFKQGSFKQLLNENSMRLEIVVTFLAILELVKRNFIETHQNGIFSDIKIEQADQWDEDSVLELEFGE